MKTFKDLKFKHHPFSDFFSECARMTFDNNYGVSVISGGSAYTDNERPYEVAILHDDSLCYDTEITDDVIGYCTKRDVTKIMKKVQQL